MEAEKVVLVADTPQELEAQIRASGIRGVATMRAPAENEPLFIGSD